MEDFAEAVPLPTFTEFGAKEYLVADERGYGYLLYKIAEDFLSTSDGKIVDSRLQLNKVTTTKHMFLSSFISRITIDVIGFGSMFLNT